MKAVKVILFIFFLPAMSVNINCGGQEEEELIRPVKYMEVYKTGGTRLTKFPGRVQLDKLTALRFNVSGALDRIAINSSSRVEVGDLVAQLEQQDYETNMKKARGQFEAALMMYDELLSKVSIDSDSALADTELLNAENKLNKAQIRFLKAEYELRETILYAPVEGVVKKTFLETGEVIEPDDTVAVIETESAVRVNVNFPAALLGGVNEGDEVTVKFSENSKETLPANIEYISRDTGRYKQTVLVSVKLQAEFDIVDSGDNARVTFLLSQTERTGGIVIPTTALIQKGDDRFVYVLKPLEGILARTELKKIVTAELKPEGIEVTRGLNEGDLIITAGVDRIKENQTVKLLSNGD